MSKGTQVVSHSRRKRDLELLVRFALEQEKLRELLDRYDWDHPDPLVTLSKQHVLRVIRRYKQGKLDRAQLEWWASKVEARDDIGYQAGAEDQLSSAIIALSTPEIHTGEFRDIVARIEECLALA